MIKVMYNVLLKPKLRLRANKDGSSIITIENSGMYLYERESGMYTKDKPLKIAKNI